MKWCWHMSNYIEKGTVTTADNQSWHVPAAEAFKFCPICGTPRPKDKEKLVKMSMVEEIVE